MGFTKEQHDVVKALGYSSVAAAAKDAKLNGFASLTDMLATLGDSDGASEVTVTAAAAPAAIATPVATLTPALAPINPLTLPIASTGGKSAEKTAAASKATLTKDPRVDGWAAADASLATIYRLIRVLAPSDGPFKSKGAHVVFDGLLEHVIALFKCDKSQAIAMLSTYVQRQQLQSKITKRGPRYFIPGELAESVRSDRKPVSLKDLRNVAI